MVCGYDTYHDSSQRDRSVGAFVSSLNDTASRWYSQAVFQGRGSELQDNLSPLLRSKYSRYSLVRPLTGLIRHSRNIELAVIESCTIEHSRQSGLKETGRNEGLVAGGRWS